MKIPCVGGIGVITGQSSGTTGGPCWNTASQYTGKYSKDDASGTYECVQCSGTKKTKLLADTASIKVDCSGNAPSSNLCESACGADTSCDEKNAGDCTTSTSLQKCSSSCSPVSSCGDGTVNCGEDCEPPGTAACDSNCKSTCTNCANAQNLGSGSISIGGYEASYTCGVSSSNTQDWLKITASNNGKLKIELTPPAGYDYDLYVYANDCSTSLCSSVKTGDAVDSCTIDAAATTTYKVKISRYSGSGAAAVSAYLEECFVDSNCPSAKPYCTNNVCVECINNPDGSFTGCLGTDGTQNTYCPKDSPTPNYILPSCDLTLNECQCEAECSTGSECALNFCCTGESLGPSEISGECVQKSTVRNPWLCT